jgi:ubiquinone/menaquinone biosynthesis C-methylase UbiE
MNRDNAMKNQATLIQAFSEMAPQYEKKVNHELNTFWGWSYDGFIDHLIQAAPIQPGDTVLDVATGTLVIPLKIIKQKIDCRRIIGLDITLAMLQAGKKKLDSAPADSPIALTCASALSMPYPRAYFDIILCGLATHHMDVPVLLREMSRVIKPGGWVTLADVAGSLAWKKPWVRALLQTAAFLYFLPSEGAARAKSEAEAVHHVYTADEWEKGLRDAGFVEIQITELVTKRTWSPAPLVMRAKKS